MSEEIEEIDPQELEKQKQAYLVEALKEFIFNSEYGMCSQANLKIIAESHNAIVLSNFNNFNFFGKHYSVNLTWFNYYMRA